MALPERKRVYTYADYEKLPEGAPYQLIGGDLIKEPSPVPYHQILSKRIALELANFVENNGLGEVLYAPTDVYFSDKEVYQPDIMFISKERMNIIGEKNIEAAPDLIIEILSPSSAYYDLRHKMRVYETSGGIPAIAGSCPSIIAYSKTLCYGLAGGYEDGITGKKKGLHVRGLRETSRRGAVSVDWR